MYETILVPTDGSDNGLRAADYAVELATETGATIHALSVVDATTLEPFTATETRVEELRSSLRRHAEEAAESVATRARDAGVDVVTEVRVGIPHETITEYADEAGADVVVMGTHGRTGITRAILGSVTERVVGGGGVPVLTVSPD